MNWATVAAVVSAATAVVALVYAFVQARGAKAAADVARSVAADAKQTARATALLAEEASVQSNAARDLAIAAGAQAESAARSADMATELASAAQRHVEVVDAAHRARSGPHLRVLGERGVAFRNPERGERWPTQTKWILENTSGGDAFDVKWDAVLNLFGRELVEGSSVDRLAAGESVTLFGIFEERIEHERGFQSDWVPSVTVRWRSVLGSDEASFDLSDYYSDRVHDPHPALFESDPVSYDKKPFDPIVGWMPS